MPGKPKPPKSGEAREHDWQLLPLAFRVDATYRATNPPPLRRRKCRVCALVQVGRAEKHGSYIKWPACGACPGPKK